MTKLITTINALCEKADHAIDSVDAMCNEWEAMGFPLVIVDKARYEAERRPFVTRRMIRIASRRLS